MASVTVLAWVSPLVLVLAACSGPAGGASAGGPTVSPTPAASSSPAESAVATVAAVVTAGVSATPASPASPAETPAGTRPGGPQGLSLSIGQTARLRYFDVTVQRFAHGKDGISAGYRVQVCYAAPHPSANADGTTRVSTDPWSFLVRDGESGGRYRQVPVGELPRDWAWSPSYRETLLRAGECSTGWIGVRHGSPDLQWGGIVYQPADFGDRVTWT